MPSKGLVSARIPEAHKATIDEVASCLGVKRSELLAEVIGCFCETKATRDYNSKIRFEFTCPEDETEKKIRKSVVKELTRLTDSLDRTQKALSYRIAEQLADERFTDLQERASEACEMTATLVEEIRRAVLFRPYVVDEECFRTAVERVEGGTNDPVSKLFYQLAFGEPESEGNDP